MAKATASTISAAKLSGNEVFVYQVQPISAQTIKRVSFAVESGEGSALKSRLQCYHASTAVGYQAPECQAKGSGTGQPPLSLTDNQMAIHCTALPQTLVKARGVTGGRPEFNKRPPNTPCVHKHSHSWLYEDL